VGRRSQARQEEKMSTRVPWQDYKTWKDYGLENGYDKRSPGSLYKSENKKEKIWYEKGVREKWAKNFSFNRIWSSLNIRFKTYSEWEEYGIKHGYDQRKPSSLLFSKDKNERYWFNKGTAKKWNTKFNYARKFKRITSYPFQQSFSEWKKYGLEHRYNKRSKGSLSRSKNKKERSWINKGRNEAWLDSLSFFNRSAIPQDCKILEKDGSKRSRKKRVSRSLKLEDYHKWEEYGVEQGYNKRTQASLRFSKIKTERRWINKGFYNKWIKKINFYIESPPWQDFKNWEEYGIGQGYNKRNVRSLSRSLVFEERRWYKMGERKKWLNNFEFNKIIEHNHFFNSTFWKKYGIEHGYNKRTTTSVRKSELKEERSWHGYGYRHKLLESFLFVRTRGIAILTDKQLQQFIKETPQAEAISQIATANGYASEAAEIMVKLFPERFTSASKLALSLPGAIKGIGHSLKPFSFTKARKLKERIRSLPQEIQYQLEDMLFSIACDQYQLKFNKNPDKTISELERFVEQNEETEPLVSRVLEYYQNIADFDIPGFGSLD
jgi:hypothetical protein